MCGWRDATLHCGACTHCTPLPILSSHPRRCPTPAHTSCLHLTTFHPLPHPAPPQPCHTCYTPATHATPRATLDGSLSVHTSLAYYLARPRTYTSRHHSLLATPRLYMLPIHSSCWHFIHFGKRAAHTTHCCHALRTRAADYTTCPFPPPDYPDGILPLPTFTPVSTLNTTRYAPADAHYRYRASALRTARAGGLPLAHRALPLDTFLHSASCRLPPPPCRTGWTVAFDNSCTRFAAFAYHIHTPCSFARAPCTRYRFRTRTRHTTLPLPWVLLPYRFTWAGPVRTLLHRAHPHRRCPPAAATTACPALMGLGP